MNFKLIKTYHKPYKVFSDPYVLNLGNLAGVKNSEENAGWLKNNMDYCVSIDNSVFSRMNSEFSVWNQFINDNADVLSNMVISLQHYSKTLDLTTVQDVPYHDFTQTEDKNGGKYKNAISLDEFGYGKIDEYFEKYDLIVGNQYPCNIKLSIKSNMNIELTDVIDQYSNILMNFNDPLFTVDRLHEYLTLPYQYWRGGPLITEYAAIKRILDFTIKFEHAFLDSKPYSTQEIYKNKDGRGNGYLGEMVMGFAIYCYVEACKHQNKRVGYCRLLTDANVIFGNTKQ